MNVQCKPQTDTKLDELQAYKEKVYENANELSAVALELKNNTAVQTISDNIGALRKERFNIAVLGNFKRGKSTFINALLGSPILPTGIVPLTSVVTDLMYGRTTSAIVHFNSGGQMNIGIDDIGQYITEHGNPGNVKEVKDVDVYVDSSLLNKGVTFIDTPGIGSTYADNTRTTYDLLSKLDAAIVVIGSDPPIGQNELDLIEEIRRTVDMIFFVQNKIDIVSREECREALLFSRAVIKDSLYMDVRIYPVSSKKGLNAKCLKDASMFKESGFPVLEKDLEHFMAVEKGQVLLNAVTKKLLRTLTDLRTALEIEKNVLDESSGALDQKMSWLKNEIGLTNRRVDEIEYLIDGGIDQISKSLDSDLDAFRSANQPTLVSGLDIFFERSDQKLGPKAFLERMEQYISENISEAYMPFIDQEEKKVSTLFKDLVIRFEKEADALDDVIRNEISATFNIEIAHPQSIPLDMGKSRFYFDRAAVLDHDTMIPVGAIFLLPRPVYRKVIKKKAVVTIIDELDKQDGKLRYDLLYRLSENVRHVKIEQRSRSLATLQTIQEAAQAASVLRNKVQYEKTERSQHIARLKSDLDRIRSSLGQIFQC